MVKGLFIAVEGPNGAGKTTFCANLKRRLDALSIPCHLVSEPSRRDVGDLVRVYREKIPAHSLVLACLLAADRYANLVEDIMPKLNDGCVVISDRYLLSMLVYQTMDGLEYRFLKGLNSYILKPDITIVMSTTFDVALKRVIKRGNSSPSENPTKLIEEFKFYELMLPKLNDFGHDYISLSGRVRDMSSIAKWIAEKRRSLPET